MITEPVSSQKGEQIKNDQSFLSKFAKKHLIERRILLASDNTIKHIHLPYRNVQTLKALADDDFIIKTIDENERDFILKTLKYRNGKIGGRDCAARLLGVPTNTLNSKIKGPGIKKDHHL